RGRGHGESSSPWMILALAGGDSGRDRSRRREVYRPPERRSYSSMEHRGPGGGFPGGRPLGDLPLPSAPEAGEICEVLRPAGALFLADQIVQIEKERRHPAELRVATPLPGVLEIDSARQARHEIDAVGGDPELDDPAGLEQILGADRHLESAEELADRVEDRFDVRGGRIDEEVEVLRRPRDRMKRVREPADDEVPNPPRVARLEKFLVIGVIHRSPAP